MTGALWTATDAAQATQGSAAGNWQASSVSIDSRSLNPGALYVALKGERVDGHDYVADALAKGAVAAMVSHAIDGIPLEKLLLVDDTAAALSALGKSARERTRARIIGVTGSIGKTTTKEMLALMCRKFGRTFATQGNYNNHFGVPLMLANMPLDTEYGIFEMGMNHAGEIAALTRIVAPHIAVITTVEAVHLEFFESVNAIADAKSEIFEGLTHNGVAILNRDNAYYARCKAAAERLRVPRVVSFGRHPDADVRIITEASADVETTLTAELRGQAINYRLQATGEAAIVASVIALTAADALCLNLPEAAEALAAFKEVEGRGQITALHFTGKPMWWMDDSYNASPASMRAAFKKLSDFAVQQKSVRRRIVVLGEMRELGTDAPRFHAELASDLARLGIDKVYASGALMKHLADALPKSMLAAYVTEAAGLAPILTAELQAGDAVLFKGSHGSHIYKLVETLKSGTTLT